MSLELHPVHRDTASMQRLEILLTEAVGLADTLGLNLAAIRIEEAVMAMREVGGHPGRDLGNMLLN
jgi:hypothetical protein